MTGNVLLSDHDYLKLRVESRQALYELGVSSNPGFTDRNIINGLSRALGIPSNFPETADWSEYSGELFRDSLGEILGLEVPPRIDDVVTGLRNIYS